MIQIQKIRFELRRKAFAASYRTRESISFALDLALLLESVDNKRAALCDKDSCCFYHLKMFRVPALFTT